MKIAFDEGPGPVLRSTAARADQPRPVVLVRSSHASHRNAARWAASAAAALGTEVVVVRLEVSRPREHALAAVARWRRAHLDEKLPATRIVLVDGLAALAEVVEWLRPRLAVVPEARSWPSDGAVRLAAVARVPVLSACRPPRPGPVVAASSLEDRSLPVLRQAAHWARLFHWPLTVVHNLDWGGLAAALPVVPIWHEATLGPANAGLLEKAANDTDAAVTVTRTPDPVAAILEVAQEADAELVVVGVSRGRRRPRRRVTARVLANARRNVLVVPLPE